MKRVPLILTIEELLKSRRKHPIATLEYAKDVARRIKKLEKRVRSWKKK